MQEENKLLRDQFKDFLDQHQKMQKQNEKNVRAKPKYAKRDAETNVGA